MIISQAGCAVAQGFTKFTGTTAWYYRFTKRQVLWPITQLWRLLTNVGSAMVLKTTYCLRKEKVWTMTIVLMSEMVIILHCHFEFSICGCVLQMWGIGGGGTPLNLTSKIFVCLIIRFILWSGSHGLLINAPGFSWPVSQVYFWISGFRCTMWSYSISVYTAVAIFAKYISL